MNVFDFAMDVERCGSRYYRNLAEKTDKPGLKTIFTMMVRDEEELLERFRAMKARAQAAVMEDSVYLDEVENPFERLSGDEGILEAADDLQVYLHLISIERTICRLYENAALREPNREARKLLLSIAAEERRELESLRRVYNFVNAPNEYLAWSEFSNLDEFHNFGRDQDI